MRLSSRLLLAVALIGVPASNAIAQAGTKVLPVAARNATLALASELLSKEKGELLSAAGIIRDPFELQIADVLAVVDASVKVAPAAPRYNDRQILEAIAPMVRPSGSARIRSTDYLLFGQKRLKAGEMLTITYEGSAYLIEIVSIQRNNFRIRLNNEELVRPIK